MSRLRDVAAWCEGDTPASIPLPGNGPNVYLSKKCADSDIGCAFICALVWAAADEYEKAAA